MGPNLGDTGSVLMSCVIAGCSGSFESSNGISQSYLPVELHLVFKYCDVIVMKS